MVHTVQRVVELDKEQNTKNQWLRKVENSNGGWQLTLSRAERRTFADESSARMNTTANERVINTEREKYTEHTLLARYFKSTPQW